MHFKEKGKRYLQKSFNNSESICSNAYMKLACVSPFTNYFCLVSMCCKKKMKTAKNYCKIKKEWINANTCKLFLS